jgi:hypothetical protein
VCGVVEEVAVDDVGESALEGSECFAAGVAVGDSALDEGSGVDVAAALGGDGDAMEGAVQLSVARTSQAVPLPVA